MRLSTPAVLDRHRNAVIPAIGGALFIAFGAIFIRLSHVAPAAAAFYRCLYALPVLAMLAWQERRSRGERPLGAHLFALAAGLLFGIDLVLWCESIVYVGAGLATVLSNVQVVIFPLAAWLLISERPSLRLGVAVPIALSGVFLISGEVGGGAYGRNPGLGAVYGIASGLAYTASLLCMKLAGESEARHTRARLFELTISSTLATGAIGLALGQLRTVPSLSAQFWLVLLALGSQVAGWLLITWALPRIAAGETAVVLTLQPAGSVLLAMLILGEKPSPLQLIGVCAIAIAIPLLAVRSASRLPALTEGAGAGRTR
ncbi:MAG: DMT family transporter [Gaiellaceae bacterium]|jgi:drug/metabolite transporter (DMT)-like permease